MPTAAASKKTVRINGCVAAAQAAKYADVDVITAYPIRPYTATMMAVAQMVANGELKAPVVIGRDHLDSGSVASPNRETEAMRDGSDAVSDWPMLNALLNCASGATWVSLHHGGGVGMGFSQHAGMVIVCDGTKEAARRIERVLWNDPASGVMRHADAGYDSAIACAREHGLDLPMLTGR